MRVGDEVVDQHDHDHAQQERQGAVGEAGALAIGQREGCNGLVEDLRQRHIHHRAAGEGQAEGQQARIGPAREQHQQAADGGGQTGREGARERDPDTTALGKAGAARARRASACLVGARAINRRGASVLRWRSTGPASAAGG
ncbi:hypothetical protein G6F62_013811 [Rhizopus arrhizus]|nr:hypothetical protein G6F62_013811 [Rhizopus arrhizus]